LVPPFTHFRLLSMQFACGASVTKTPSLVEQIEMQGEFMDKLAELIIKTYGASNGVTKENIFYVG